MKRKQLPMNIDAMCAAVEAYLHTMSLIPDKAEVMSVKQDIKTGTFYADIEVQ